MTRSGISVLSRRIGNACSMKRSLAPFFGKVLSLAQWHGLVSSEHFSVGGKLIEAWASAKSFKAKDGSGKSPEGGGHNATVDFAGEERKNDTHASTTDPDARLFKKSKGNKSRLCYMGHALMENWNGLAVDVETMLATGKAEREASAVMTKRSLKRGSTLGADKNYDTAGFVKAMREQAITPHVAIRRTAPLMDGRPGMPVTVLACACANALKKSLGGRRQ